MFLVIDILIINYVRELRDKTPTLCFSLLSTYRNEIENKIFYSRQPVDQTKRNEKLSFLFSYSIEQTTKKF